MTREFLQAGDCVVICGRNPERLQAAVAALWQEVGGDAAVLLWAGLCVGQLPLPAGCPRTFKPLHTPPLRLYKSSLYM